ncbi:acyl-CoA thioesterase [Brevibacillus dissolubilis]|uniref:acyl-CoA thioesterase n=1 Tax=Brevibacillus dissolubilis TaxID=1844116 RepID=UPI0011163088|nr:thioesterase family protein [Brevibacillus dissolubilis]
MEEQHYRVFRLRVRYSETDQMGVVYHTNYLNWFEWGRTEFIREAGLSYKQLEDAGILLPVTDAQISFKAPARYDELIEVRTWVEDLTELRLTFGYEICRVEDGELLVTGQTRLVAVNAEWKPARMSKLSPDIYGWLKQEYLKTKAYKESLTDAK